jgi:hypothetical protein
MQRSYNKEANINHLIDKLRRYFQKQGYDAKVVSSDILEVSKTSTPRKVAGLSSGLRIAVTVKRGQTLVEISGYVEEYVLKGGVAMVAAVFSAGLLALVPIYGAYQEHKLVKAAWEEIDDYFNDLIVE